MQDNNDEISDKELVTAYRYGDSLEISNVTGSTPTVIKCDRDHMVNTKTGEIIRIEHATNRADPKNAESLRKTFKRLKRIIGTNFHGGKSELWVTLTYKWQDYNNSGKKEPMTDPQRLFKDFRIFMHKLRKKVGKYIAYIETVEPQASGSFHCHVLMKTLDGSRLYISNKDMSECWGQGFVSVRRLKESDNVGAYLMAYLTNIDVNDPDGKNETKGKKGKSIIKGGRLGLYPMHFQIYRRSRKGIKNPQKLKGSCGSIKKRYEIKTSPSYYKSFSLQRPNGEIFEVKTEYFNLKKVRLEREIKRMKHDSK